MQKYVQEYEFNNFAVIKITSARPEYINLTSEEYAFDKQSLGDLIKLLTLIHRDLKG